MKLIITVENLKEFRPISEDIPESRINPYIQEAQQLDLKRLLGPALFVDFLAKFDDAAQGATYTNYQLLFKGTTYTYGGYTVEHPGLIGYLAYSALARLYANNQINVVKYGLVQKLSDKSEALSDKAVQMAVDELRSNALALQADIVRYLNTNIVTFPLFVNADGSVLDDNGVKFFDPDSDTIPGYNGRTLKNW